MFRASFRLTDRLREAGDWGRLLRDAAPSGVLVVAGFLDSKTVEAYLDVDPGVEVHAVTDVLAQRLGFDEYEVTAVEWLRIPPGQTDPSAAAEPGVSTTPPPTPTAPPTVTTPVAAQASPSVTGQAPLLRVHPGTITQVTVKPDGRTLSVKVRHRRNEAIAGIDVDETAETVALAASVGTPDGDRRADFASFGVTFSWAEAELAREVGARRIIHSDAGIAGPASDAPSRPVVGGVIAETPAVEDAAVQSDVESSRQPDTAEYAMSDETSHGARRSERYTRPKRPPFVLMLLFAVAVALFLSRRTRHR